MQGIQTAIGGTAQWAYSSLSRLEAWIAHQVLGEWTPREIPDLTGKVALVTGGNSGLGYQIARKLAENGAHVYIVSRIAQNGVKAVTRLKDELGSQVKLDTLECNMSSLSNVVALAQEFKRRNRKLDLLIHSAGVFQPGPFAMTNDGIEQTLAVNYYAMILLTLLLLEVIRAAAGSRVVFIGSEAELSGRLQWDNLTGERYRDSSMVPYGTSKLYGMMALKELSVRVPEVDFLCVHPGVVRTEIQHKVSFRYFSAMVVVAWGKLAGLSPYRGAFSALYAATEPSLRGTHFGYYGPTSYHMWMTAPREPNNPLSYLWPSWFGTGPSLPQWLNRRPVSDAASCWRLFMETINILQSKLGVTLMLLPESRPVMKNSASFQKLDSA